MFTLFTQIFEWHICRENDCTGRVQSQWPTIHVVFKVAALPNIEAVYLLHFHCFEILKKNYELN